MIKKIHLLILLSMLSACTFEQPDYVKAISSTDLNLALHNKDIFLVDVHTPKGPQIKGTDAFIPYNQVEQNQSKLPQDKNTAIYVYCLGGPMGVSAAKSLHELGYTQIFNLTGGSNAWQAAGFEFE
ncbi:MAG: rhodanese-like domain-containing protein [Methyloprofundus sp.]|nr:rhodanese-like domain-containing protein [Methyloprofundus sp.]